MLKASLVFGILFLMHLSGFAQSAADLLEQDLLTKVSNFQKSIQIYHYFRAPVIQTGNPNSPSTHHPVLNNKETRDLWVNDYISGRAGLFWDLNHHNTAYNNAGPGVYFAIDPDSSKEFGETSVVMNIPSGSKFISVFRPIALRRETTQALLREGYITTAQMNLGAGLLGLKSGFSRLTLQFMVTPENLRFRTLVNEIFTRHEISFIEYEYKSHLAGFCRIANQAAFVYIGRNPQVAQPNDFVSKQYFGAALEPAFQNMPLFSSYQFLEQTPDEITMKDLITRFGFVLAQIRIQGTRAAKQLIPRYLQEPEVISLVDRSYQCVRRF